MKKLLLILGLGLVVGCSNSEILVIKEDTPIPIKTVKGDSYIFLGELNHSATPKYIFYNDAEKELKIYIKTKKNDVEKINLVIDGEKIEMESLGYQGEREIFTADILDFQEKKISYYFEIIDADFKYYYGEKSSYEKDEVEKFDYTINFENRELPTWSKGVVWYSIYVDRFRDGDEYNSPIYSEFGPEYYFRPSGRLSDGSLRSELVSPEKWQTKGTLQGFKITEWGKDWNTPPYSEIEAENRYYPHSIKNIRRYGGDLQGVEEKLDYLKELGVEGINLSPIFYSDSSNKLDIIDYGHISPDYAITTKESYRELNNNLDIDSWTESDLFFQSLVDKIHEKEMRIVLDINFSYVSPDFFAYKDFVENKENSKYKNWFIVSENLEGENESPQKVYLNLDDEELQDYLIKATSKWVKGNKNRGIDGYFVKNDISNDEFLARWKKELLEINNEFIIVGESTKENENYVGIGGFDILGSYELGIWMQELLGNNNENSIEDVKGEIRAYNIKTPRWNFIESYDTDRFYSGLVNPNREFDRMNNHGKDDFINIDPNLVDSTAIKKLKLATLIQLTIDGSPVIYYGAEKAMWGADAPDSRKPMLWEDITFENETDSLENYRKNRRKIATIFKTDMIKDDISYPVMKNKELEDFYKQIEELRKFDYELLKYGDLNILDLNYEKYLDDGSIEEVLEKDILAFKREYKGRSVIIVVNRSGNKKEIKIPVDGKKGYTDYYLGDRYPLKGSKLGVELEGYGYLVLYRKINFD
jgi:glycosidase